MRIHTHHVTTCLALAAGTVTALAQVTPTNWDGEAGDNLWSTGLNWDTDLVPGEFEIAQYVGIESNTVISITEDTKIGQVMHGWESTTNLTLAAGGGTLTIDAAWMNNWGIVTQAFNEDVVTTIEAPLIINNLDPMSFTQVTSKYRPDNTLRIMGPLHLETRMMVTRSELIAGKVEFGGLMTGPGSLLIRSFAVTLVAGHDSSTLIGEIVLDGTASTITIEEGAKVLRPNIKIQLNGRDTEPTVILNGTDVIQGYLRCSPGAKPTVIINAPQYSMDRLEIETGFWVFDMTAGQPLWIVDTSNYEANWGTGTGETSSLTIKGFQEGLLRFGTHRYGLTPAQLAKISVEGSTDPVYLDYDGYVTLIEPTPDPIRDIFATAIPSSDSVYDMSSLSMGLVYTGHYPWVHSEIHGWLWADAAVYDAYWMHDFEMGWIYAYGDAPQIFYRASDGAMLYWDSETSVYNEGRRFYNYNTSAWEDA